VKADILHFCLRSTVGWPPVRILATAIFAVVWKSPSAPVALAPSM
jgi:hypothetical protein